METATVRIFQTHLTILSHELDRASDNTGCAYVHGQLDELRSIIKQTGGRIVNGVVTYGEE